jgi:hypothetical protein
MIKNLFFSFLFANFYLAVFLDSAGAAIVEWDFSKDTHGWAGNPRVSNLLHSDEGLTFKSIGEDPWIEGPAVDLPESKMIRVTIRMKSDADRSGQLFYGPVFTEPMSKRFQVSSDNQWHDYSLFIHDGAGANTRFRLDPCRGPGTITLAHIKIEAIEKISQPKLTVPSPVSKSRWNKYKDSLDPIEIIHYGKSWGDFSVMVDNVEMGIGYDNELIGIMFNDGSQWMDLSEAKITVKQIQRGKEFLVEATVVDNKGGQWKISRRFTAEKVEGTVTIETEVSVDKNRSIVRLPWLTLFSGVGTFGQRKHQGLFAGLEYLTDEPSSSKADIIGLEHMRRIPDGIKITFPLMAIEHEGRYVGLVWQQSDMTAAEFDSPDRIYNSGGHLMGLSAPAVGPGRFENEFAAYEPITIQAGKPLQAKAMIIAGNGDSVIDAVKHYLRIAPLPNLPTFENGFSDAADLLAHGWLDSAINEDWLFRHAVWGKSFGAGPAADAAVFMDWLANHTEDTALKEKLNHGRDKVIEKLPAGNPFASSVSHVRFPAGPFLFGRVDEYVQARKNQARALLKEFDKNGIKLYRPGKADYGKTHFANHANGLAGTSLVQILSFSINKQSFILTQSREALRHGKFRFIPLMSWRRHIWSRLTFWAMLLPAGKIYSKKHATGLGPVCLSYILTTRQTGRSANMRQLLSTERQTGRHLSGSDCPSNGADLFMLHLCISWWNTTTVDRGSKSPKVLL